MRTQDSDPSFEKSHIHTYFNKNCKWLVVGAVFVCWCLLPRRKNGDGIRYHGYNWYLGVWVYIKVWSLSIHTDEIEVGSPDSQGWVFFNFVTSKTLANFFPKNSKIGRICTRTTKFCENKIFKKKHFVLAKNTTKFVPNIPISAVPLGFFGCQ